MLSDLISHLKENKYLPLAEINNSFLHKQLTDTSVDYYVKIVQKRLDYENKNNEVIFVTNIVFALVAVVQNDELVDFFALPINPFCIRTRQDRAAIDEILDEMEADFTDYNVDCDA